MNRVGVSLKVSSRRRTRSQGGREKASQAMADVLGGSDDGQMLLFCRE